MNLRLVVILASCLTILVTPASSTSLLAAAAAVKGAIIGAGLSALKSGGGSETVIIQSKPGSVAEVVPANQIAVQDLGTLHNSQTITYTSSNPISRLWDSVSNAVAAKAKAIGDIFRPNRKIVVVVPQTTEKPTTEKPTQVIIELENKPPQWQTIDVIKPPPSGSPIIGIDLGNKPLMLPGIDVELNHKPLMLPSIDVELNHKPLMLPSIDVELNHKPLMLPSIDVELNHKPLMLPSIDVELNHKPLMLPSIDVELNHKPLMLPSIDVELNHKPLMLPSIDVELNHKPLPSFGLSASIGRGNMFRRIQPVAFINYLKK